MLDTNSPNGLPRRPKLPQTGIPLVDAIEILNGPTGLLGRFFVQADSYVCRKNLTLEFASFEEMAETQACHHSSWASLNPMFDPRLSDIPPDRALCVVARNRAGEIMATCAAKTWDAHQRSFKNIVEDGDFFSLRPSKDVVVDARITAPIAATMHGELMHNGGLWIHPDIRGGVLARLLSKTATAAAIALWDPDFVIAFLKTEAVRPNLVKGYGAIRAEPSLTATLNGKLIYDGVMLWMTREDAATDLAFFLNELAPEINAAVAT